MSLRQVVLLVATCDTADCEVSAEYRTPDANHAIGKMRRRGWVVRQNKCYCPEHAEPLKRAGIQAHREKWLRAHKPELMA